MLRLKREDLQKIYAQAGAEYPAECCGVLTAAGEGGCSQVHPCQNIQDRLHQENPREYPRDSRIAYYLDPGELYRILADAQRAGSEISGFYHSHIDCDAYFSAEDRQRAMAWGEPAYPQAVYLVLSVWGRQVKGYRCFAWDAGKRDFAEVELEVVE